MTVPGIGDTSVTIGNKKYPYTPPTMVLDKDGKWIPTAAPGMADLEKLSREKSTTAFDGEAFMKLLVAQLKYQDPNKPADSSQIMQQSAMLAMTEQMATMSKSNETIASSYASMLAEQRAASAVSLVGKDVKYTIPNPDTTDTKNPTISGEGQVESVKFTASGPMLMVKGKEIPLSAVDSVASTAAPAPAPAPAPGPKAEPKAESSGSTSSSESTSGTPA